MGGNHHPPLPCWHFTPLFSISSSDFALFVVASYLPLLKSQVLQGSCSLAMFHVLEERHVTGLSLLSKAEGSEAQGREALWAPSSHVPWWRPELVPYWGDSSSQAAPGPACQPIGGLCPCSRPLLCGKKEGHALLAALPPMSRVFVISLHPFWTHTQYQGEINIFFFSFFSVQTAFQCHHTHNLARGCPHVWGEKSRENGGRKSPGIWYWISALLLYSRYSTLDFLSVLSSHKLIVETNWNDVFLDIL